MMAPRKAASEQSVARVMSADTQSHRGFTVCILCSHIAVVCQAEASTEHGASSQKSSPVLSFEDARMVSKPPMECLESTHDSE